jgi:hypothetical protein
LKEIWSDASYGLSVSGLPPPLQAVPPAPRAITSSVQLTTVRVRGMWFMKMTLGSIVNRGALGDSYGGRTLRQKQEPGRS